MPSAIRKGRRLGERDPRDMDRGRRCSHLLNISLVERLALGELKGTRVFEELALKNSLNGSVLEASQGSSAHRAVSLQKKKES